MTVDEYVAQEQRTGARFHRANGVWWHRVKPFFCVAVPQFRLIRPGEARPHWSAALAGYQHGVPYDVPANARVGIMVLEDPKGYDLSGLSVNKRRNVRLGLKRVEVRPIAETEELVSQGFRINLSALTRQNWGGSTTANWKRWSSGIRLIYPRPDREAWGAYAEGRLVAYLLALTLDDDVYVHGMMSESEALPLYPNDALLHRFLESCRDRSRVQRVIFGLYCAKPSLNTYKQRFGFVVQHLRLYRRLNPAVRLLLKFSRRYRHYLDFAEGSAQVVGDRDVGGGAGPRPRGARGDGVC